MRAIQSVEYGVVEMAGARAEQSYNGWNGEYIDAMYARWCTEHESVDPQWQRFFAGFELALDGHRPARPRER